jgi:hypothetical protein
MHRMFPSVLTALCALCLLAQKEERWSNLGFRLVAMARMP